MFGYGVGAEMPIAYPSPIGRRPRRVTERGGPQPAILMGKYVGGGSRGRGVTLARWEWDSSDQLATERSSKGSMHAALCDAFTYLNAAGDNSRVRELIAAGEAVVAGTRGRVAASKQRGNEALLKSLVVGALSDAASLKRLGWDADDERASGRGRSTKMHAALADALTFLRAAGDELGVVALKAAGAALVAGMRSGATQSEHSANVKRLKALVVGALALGKVKNGPDEEYVLVLD